MVYGVPFVSKFKNDRRLSKKSIFGSQSMFELVVNVTVQLDIDVCDIKLKPGPIFREACTFNFNHCTSRFDLGSMFGLGSMFS